jgi:integrase
MGVQSICRQTRVVTPLNTSLLRTERSWLTGWRIPSEVLTLQWRQVDFTAGQVRLDPGTTKNNEGRVFPMTAQLRGSFWRSATSAIGYASSGVPFALGCSTAMVCL